VSFQRSRLKLAGRVACGLFATKGLLGLGLTLAGWKIGPLRPKGPKAILD